MNRTREDEEKLRRIYRANYRQIAAYAHRRVGDAEADDVISEVFLVAWRRLEAVPDGELTLPWLYGVARRVVSDRGRSRRRRARLVARMAAAWGREGSQAVEPHVLSDAVHVTLNRLRPKDQEILRLSEWEGLTNEQLAVALGCSVNAAAIRLHRAHRRFAGAFHAADTVAEPSEKVGHP